mgnify:CR=1 FL=1
MDEINYKLDLLHSLLIETNSNIESEDTIYNQVENETNNNINSDGRNKSKSFKWHKMYLFDVYLKKWNYIFCNN